MNRVRHSEVTRKLPQSPTAVLARKKAAIDQHAEQLLDEEGISLGPLDDELAELDRQAAREQLVQHPDRVLRGERLQLEQLTAGATAPARSALEQFGSRGRDQEQRSSDAAE